MIIAKIEIFTAISIASLRDLVNLLSVKRLEGHFFSSLWLVVFPEVFYYWKKMASGGQNFAVYLIDASVFEALL